MLGLRQLKWLTLTIVPLSIIITLFPFSLPLQLCPKIFSEPQACPQECTNLLQQQAIVHTSQMCHEQCAQGCSGNWQLCTPPANYAMTGVHKSNPAMGYCAHHLYHHGLPSGPK